MEGEPMRTIAELKHELYDLIAETKAGFAAEDPRVERLKAVIYALAEQNPYTDSVRRADVHGGRWDAIYWSFGGQGQGRIKGQGTGVETTLADFSMQRLPPIPYIFLDNALENDPATGRYHFHARIKLGREKIPALQYTLGHYVPDETNGNRFLVDFHTFDIRPEDNRPVDDAFAAAVGAPDATKLRAQFPKMPQLYTDIIFIDDELRIQRGQLDGHYVMKRSAEPMQSMWFGRDGQPSEGGGRASAA
jgi:hypothetical protein